MQIAKVRSAAVQSMPSIDGNTVWHQWFYDKTFITSLYHRPMPKLPLEFVSSNDGFMQGSIHLTGQLRATFSHTSGPTL